MLDLRQSAHALLAENSRTVDHFQYTVPSNTSYPYQWFWDSCFHAIVWNHFDPLRAQAELDALVYRQHDSGFIGHVIYWQPSQILAIDWGIPHTSSLLQPPLLAYAIWRTYQASQDHDWLQTIYPKASAFYDYILRERDVRQCYLFGLVNPDESGEDNAPKFDKALGLPPQHDAKDNTERRYALFDVHRNCQYDARCTSKQFWVEDVAFNTYLVWNLSVMSDLAHQLNRPKDANRWRNAADATKTAMRRHMFHDGRYVSLSGLAAEPVTYNGWDQFVPLLAGLYTQDEAYRLVKERLCDPEQFWLPFGIPTVAKNDPAYAPEEPTWGEAWQHPDWRGASWQTVHWFLYHGLMRYGFTAEAASIKEKSVALIKRSGWRENYHPETGDGQGAEGFTWGTLTIDMESGRF